MSKTYILIYLVSLLTRPYLLWNTRIFFVPKRYIKRNNKNELWKTVRITNFQKPQLQSATIFFKFVYPFLLLYLLFIYTCRLTFCAVIFMFHSVGWQFLPLPISCHQSLWEKQGRHSGGSTHPHQCGPGSNPGVQSHNIMWVEFVVGSGSFAPKGFSPGTPVFNSPQNPKFSIYFQFDQ